MSDTEEYIIPILVMCIYCERLPVAWSASSTIFLRMAEAYPVKFLQNIIEPGQTIRKRTIDAYVCQTHYDQYLKEVPRATATVPGKSKK